MGWEEEHQKRVASFPPDIRDAHVHSSNHRAEILNSALCGCFYCCEKFTPKEIKDWVDEKIPGEGQTALCPKCGIDSVIGDKSGVNLSKEFLESMRAYWF
jgi:hypothetical protein